MAEAVAELVNMARDADASRLVAMERRDEYGVWTDGMSALLLMEAARRLAKRHGLPKPLLRDDDPRYRMELTIGKGARR